MANDLYWTTPTRHPEDTGIGYLRRTVLFNTPQGANGIPIGALEAGAMPLHAQVTIETGFNAGTTNVLTVGTVDDDDGFATSASVIAGTAGFKANLTGALSGTPMATSKVVYAKYTQTGTAATAGKATIVLAFVNKRGD